MGPFRRALPVLMLVFSCWPAAATVLLPLDLADLIASADLIVHGRVTDARAVVIGGRTETVVTLAALTVLKGGGESHVTFRVPGGQIGRYRTVVAGAPVLREGDEIVAFLDRGGPGVPHLVGFSQGVVRIVRQGFDGMRMVLAPPSLRGASEPQRVVRGDARQRFMTLSAFIADVRDTASVQAAGPQRAVRPAPLARVGGR